MNRKITKPIIILSYLVCLASIKKAQGQTITTIAGNRYGNALPANQARLSSPSAITMDAAGNLYIADRYNNMVRKVTASSGLMTTIAGSGSYNYNGDGIPAATAGMNYTTGVAVDAAGNVYVADQYGCRVRKVNASTGLITTVAGTGVSGSTGDGGAATNAQLKTPTGIALDAVGNLYISDNSGNKIRKVNATTGIITTVAGTGTSGNTGDGGAATSALLNSPAGIFADASNNIYVADMGNHRVRKINGTTGIITNVAGTGATGNTGDGSAATSALLNSPYGVALDANANVYIADLYDQRVRKVTAATGIITTIAGTAATSGSTGDGGLATSAKLNSPAALYFDASGNLYIADQSNNRVRKITMSTGIISSVAGTDGSYTGDGTQAVNAYMRPSCITMDGSGNVYLMDINNYKIRKISAATGIITTIAGNGSYGTTIDGPATSTPLGNIKDIVADAAGNIYTADASTNKVQKITAATGMIATIAGTGVAGYSGDGAAANTAKVSGASGLCLDAAGNLYIADTYNNRIRKVTFATGFISTVAGNGTQSFSGDNSAATSATMNNPTDVAVDNNGNIYIADRLNSRIRKVTASTNIITTIAGTGVSASTGNGVAATTAQLSTPKNISLDGSGNLYLVEDNTYTVRKITASTGIINTVVGTGTNGYNGDGISPTTAMIGAPDAIVADASGNLYVSDQYNYSVRYVCSGNAMAGDGTTAIAPLGDPSTSKPLTDRCSQLGFIQPSGSNPFTGVTNATVTVDAAVGTYRGAPYVQRHYDINPQSATPTQTATLTLYFTQAEFNAYNTAAGSSLPPLPTGAADAAGIANVRITQFHGTGTAPGNYTGWTGSGPASVLIDPADNKVVWNSTDNRWEVTFPITGFSGFYLHTANSIGPLPVSIQDFSAKLQGNKSVLLTWTMSMQDEVKAYHIERNMDGKTFLEISARTVAENQKTYTEVDQQPSSGMNYYRLRIEALNGTNTYSEVRKVSINTEAATQVYPNPASNYFIVETNDPTLLQTSATLTNVEGGLINQFLIKSTQEKVDVSSLQQGVYLLRLANGTTFKIIK